jgi:small subunit ribosomal protein S4e
MLDKLGGKYASRPSQGPHKRRECIPLSILLRNRLRYALCGKDVFSIVRDKEGMIKIDNRIRRDPRFPLGIMDVLSIEKTGEHFRILYDVKGRYQAHKIDAKEAQFKLCKVLRKSMGPNKIPYIVTHDGRTIRYPHPEIKKYDTIKLNLETGEVDGLIKFENGASVLTVGGNNIGRVGTLQHVEKHPGSFDIAHIKDANGHAFATRVGNIFSIGEGKKPVISLLPKKGIKLTPLEERNIRLHREE